MVLIKCFANIIIFPKFLNQELFETSQGKKIKTITKLLPCEHSLTDELNSTIDDTNNDLAASKYFEPNEISSLINKQTSILSFFHLNITFLLCHFKEFSTFLTENKLDFDFLGFLNFESN